MRSEFWRERERASDEGGGDFNLGEMGQWGVLSPELDPEAGLEGLETREESWFEDAGGSWGMLVDDRARWMAAAEGTVVAGKLGPRLGLTSLLLLREARVDLGWASARAAARCDWRVGEVLRDDIGEVVAERVTAARGPVLDWFRMGAGVLSEGVAAAAAAAAVGGAVLGCSRWGAGAAGVEAAGVGVVNVDADADVDVGVGVGVLADAGSATSGEPVMERKEPSSCVSVMAAIAVGCAQSAYREAMPGCDPNSLVVHNGGQSSDQIAAWGPQQTRRAVVG